MQSVVLLWHVHRVDDEDSEKLIGVYRSDEDAKAAIERQIIQVEKDILRVEKFLE